MICMCRGSSFSIMATGHFSSASGSTVWLVKLQTWGAGAGAGAGGPRGALYAACQAASGGWGGDSGDLCSAEPWVMEHHQ